MRTVDLQRSAFDDIGPHLLGTPYHHQETGDWRMADFLGTDDIEAAYLTLMKGRTSKDTKAWVTAAMPLLRSLSPQPAPAPTPTPTPPAPDPGRDSVLWSVDRWYDQSQTGHCTGFTGIGWGRCEPYPDDYQDADGHALYYEEKVLDGEPGNEDGSSIHTLAKALVNRGRLNAYAWGRSIDEIDEWLMTKGPVAIGINWYNAMFNPDAQGFVQVKGGIAGGHAIYIRGRDKSVKSNPFTIIRNSWSKSWGKAGDFCLRDADLSRLIDEDGEAMVGLELPLAA